MLTRDTDWRQGDLLTQETAARLTALNGPVGETHRIVVITHDCDLPNDGETLVEVIVTDVVAAANPQFSYAKNPRKLHLGYEIAGGSPSWLNFGTQNGASYPKLSLQNTRPKMALPRCPSMRSAH
jgi:hypothetical protein